MFYMSRIDEIDRNHTKEEMYELGKEYRDGMNEKVVMPTMAIKYFIKAGERGHIEAQYDLAFMYENGIGCEIDIEKAIEWYTAATSYNHSESKKALKRLINTAHNKNVNVSGLSEK